MSMNIACKISNSGVAVSHVTLRQTPTQATIEILGLPENPTNEEWCTEYSGIEPYLSRYFDWLFLKFCNNYVSYHEWQLFIRNRKKVGEAITPWEQMITELESKLQDEILNLQNELANAIVQGHTVIWYAN